MLLEKVLDADIGLGLSIGLTAAVLFVLPVYLASQGEEIAGLWPFLLAATAGAVAGTLAGERLLRRIPEPVYRSLVAALVLALGVFMILRIGH